MVAEGKMGDILEEAGREAGVKLRVTGFRALAKGEAEEGEGGGEVAEEEGRQ